MAVELGQAFVHIRAITEDMQRDIAKALDGTGKLGDKAGKDLGESLSQNVTKSVKGIDGDIARNFGSLEKVGSTAGKNLGNGLEKGAKGAGTKAGEQVGKEFEKPIKEHSQKASTWFRDAFTTGAIGGAVGAITAQITSSMSSLAGEALEASDATDKFKATLDFAGLDSSKIEEVTARAQKYADQTVYGLGDIQNMTAQLAANGVKDYSGLAEAAGNLNAIAGGNAETFKSVGMVMSQTAGAGKLTTENWNQLSDAIPGASGKIQEALKNAGAYTGNFRDAMADGQITAEEFNQAVMELGNDQTAVDAAKSVDTFEGAIGNLGATISGNLTKVLNATKPFLTGLINGISGLAEKYLPVMVQALETGIEKLKVFGEWVQKNKDWIAPLAASLGTVVGVFAAWNAATKIATGVQAAFNLVMAANPIMLAVMAIAALVAGLTYFFTKTETGRELWQKFTEALSNGWNWVKDTFTAGWNWIRDVVFTPMANFVQQTLWPAVQSVIQWIGDKWNWMKDIFTNAWNWIRDVVINPFVTFMTTVLWPNIMNAVQWIVDKWNWLRDMLGAAWGWIRDNVIQKFVDGFNFLWTGASNAVGWVVDKWNWMRDMLHAGWTWIDENVIDGFRRGMDKFKSFFEGVVNGIKDEWNSLRSALAKPINFMIETVYNGGILKAWETIRKFLPGLKEASPLATIPEHATGGRISGPGTGTSDDVLMWGSNGEHMLTAREVQRLGGHGHVYAMRKMVELGRPFSFDGHGDLTPLPRSTDNRAGDLYGAAPGLLPAYKDGGEIRPLWEHQLMAAHKFAQSQHGKPYQWAGPTGPGSSFDCSGFMGSIAATIQGTNPWQRYWATGSFPSPGAQGFVPGLGPGFSIGIFNGGPYGGHTAGTLGPAGPYGSVNVESGGSPSMVKYGPGAVGADHSQFTMQYHLPIGADGSFVSGGGGGISPEAMQDGLKKKVSDFVDKAMNPILSKLPVGPPEWKNVPRGVYDKGKEGMLDTAFDVVGKLGDKLASVWTAAGEVKDLVTGAVGDAASWVNDRVRSIVVRDNGGLVPSGAAAVNFSGKDELMLPPSTTALFNKFLKDMPGVAGALERSAVAFQAAAEELGLQEQARKSSEDYAAEQASGLLGTFGLEGLVPIAQKLGADAWEAYQASPYDVGANGQTIVIEYVGDENDREWKMLQKLDKEVALLKAKRKPKASAMTRGGVQ